ncbi:MAG TPA: hypothetical protein DCP08_02680 [Chloroflexi bacterium]|nr:hypothetical protein [Chloroflexota bacterium]
MRYLSLERAAFGKPFWAHWPLILILLAHFGLGVVYSTTIPLWEAYDEWGHYPYVRYVATYHALPPPGIQLAERNDESFQPPLYYILTALATFWIDTSDGLQPTVNPYAFSGTGQGGLNMAIHSDAEGFPYQGTVLALHLARLVSVAIATGGLLFTYFIAHLVFPRRREIALGTTALNAFWPQYLFMGSVVNNDILVTALSSLTLFLLLKTVLSELKTRDLCLLGSSLGLALISKNNALALVPLALIGVGVGIAKEPGERRTPRTILKWSVVFLLGVSLTSGWWFARNLFTSGQVLTRYPKRVSHLSLAITNPLLFIRGLHWDTLPRALRYSFVTFWASFGWGNVAPPEWVYMLYRFLCLGGAVGIALLLVRRPPVKIKMLLFMLILAIGFIIAIPTYLVLHSGHFYLFPGRYILPAISAVSLLLFLAWAELVGRRFEPLMAATMALSLFILALITPFRYIAPAYARPPLLDEVDLQEVEHPLHVRFGEAMELVGYKTDKDSLQPGQALTVTLHWRCLREMDENYTIAVQVLGPDYESYGGINTYPGRGNYATSLWRVGDIVQDTYRIAVSKEFPAPALAQIKVAAFSQPTLEHLPALDAKGNLIGDSAIFGRTRVSSLAQELPEIFNRVDVRFGDAVSLRGYRLSLQLHSGDDLPITLYWEALQTIDRDYTVFLHVVDARGNVIAQHDSQPRSGGYPTTLWMPGEMVEDEHAVPIPDSLPSGEYSLLIGLYSLDTLERLPAFGNDGRSLPFHQLVISGLQVSN